MMVMAPPEKLKRAQEDPETACQPPHTVKFGGGWSERRRRWKAGLLVASVLAATAVIFAVVGLVTGLGVVRSGGSDCSADDQPPSAVGGDATATESTEVESHHLATSCPSHPYPTPLPYPLPDGIESAIAIVQSRLASLVDKETMPGLVASITYRDTDLWTKGFGLTEKGDDGKSPDEHTVYRIASVSKVFVALMVYQMYDHGLIRSLDDPLVLFCPTFRIHSPFTSDNITLRQILASMSGLPREAPCGQPEDPSVNICPLNTSTILERLSYQSTILPPWTQPSYSNLGFALLGRCLAAHLSPQMTYEDYVQSHILSPLEMTETVFHYPSDSVKDRLATGYQADGSEEPLYDVGWWGPAAQMYSTASDLNKLAKFLYSTGIADDNPAYSAVLSPSLRRLMLLPTYTNRDLLTGLGTPWEVSYQQDYTLLMKGGNLRGYSAVLSVVPDLQLGLNILFSGVAKKLTLAKELHSTLIPAFVEALTVPVQYPLPPNTTHYTGLYTARWSSGNVALANIHLHMGSLALSGSAFRGIYLAYREPSRFQIEFPDSELSCLSTELLALRHSWIYFDQQPSVPSSSSGNSWQAQSFTMPGFSPDLHFTRV